MVVLLIACIASSLTSAYQARPLNEMAEAGLLKAGQKVSCIGFGGGLTWGGMIVEYKG